MDLNLEYAAHQKALMRADNASSDDDRAVHMVRASRIASRISGFQKELGAAAACAWSVAQISASGRI